MQLLPVVAGAVVPHAPLLLPELESAEVAEGATRLRKAVDSIEFDVDTVVMLSPHASRSGVYSRAAGNLAPFGVSGLDVEVPTNEKLRDGLGLPVIADPLDHGIVVPLLLRDWFAPTVGVGVVGDLHVNLDLDLRIAVVASVNLSAGLSPRAPLTEVPGAADAEAAFVEGLERDVGSARTDGLVGSCGAEVLRVFARIFQGRTARVLAHESPVGVGYVVAEVA